MPDPWSDLTEAQRRQIREAQAAAKAAPSTGCPVCGCDPETPWGCPCTNENCPCSDPGDSDDV